MSGEDFLNYGLGFFFFGLGSIVFAPIVSAMTEYIKDAMDNRKR